MTFMDDCIRNVTKPDFTALEHFMYDIVDNTTFLELYPRFVVNPKIPFLHSVPG